MFVGETPLQCALGLFGGETPELNHHLPDRLRHLR
jgi:hypothetical protein